MGSVRFVLAFACAMPLFFAIGCADPESPPVAPLDHALALVESGKWERALEQIDRLIDETPADSRLWLLRGRAMLGVRDPVGAKSDLTEAIRLAPDDSQAYYYRGLAFADLDEHEAAQADRMRARQLDSDAKKASLLIDGHDERPPTTSGTLSHLQASPDDDEQATDEPADKIAETNENLDADETTETSLLGPSGVGVAGNPDVYVDRDAEDLSLTEQLLGQKAEFGAADFHRRQAAPATSQPGISMESREDSAKPGRPAARLSPPLRPYVTGLTKPPSKTARPAEPFDQTNRAARRNVGRLNVERTAEITSDEPLETDPRQRAPLRRRTRPYEMPDASTRAYRDRVYPTSP